MKYGGVDRRSLKITVGGGNDLFTGVSRSGNERSKTQTDVAGMLSLGAYHTGVVSPITPIIKGCSRYLGYKSKINISFSDGYIIDLIQSQGYTNIGKTFHFSSRFGTERLLEDVQKLIKSEGYDDVDRDDYGGDILTRPKDKDTLSPMMDFTALNLVGNLDLDIPGTVCSLGADAELTNQKEVLEELRQEGILLGEGEFDPGCLFEVNIQQDMKYIIENDLRKGNTFPRTERMLTESESFIDQHRIYQQLEKEPFEVFRKVLIKSDYFRTYCDIDSKKLYEKNKYGASKSYDTALEYYLHLKEIAPLRKTEIDLLPIWDGNEYGKGELVLPLDPYRAFKERREEMLEKGISMLDRDIVDVLLMKHDETPSGDRYKREEVSNNMSSVRRR